ncbi:MAG TPA: alpha/beta fold hydrolase [Candidatus Baltobacteraceae bacterium]|nr:alpha/beta fold hydrolase [Candidatus Baltobacteraceae bacterium]
MNFERAYTTYGDPANPTILFVHGIRLGRDIWSWHARELASRYFVVTVDLPGHGALENEAFTTANIAALFNHVLRDVCSAAPLIVGYSLGGYAAIEYAQHYPEHSRGLLLAGCTLDFEGWKRWPYELSTRLSEMLPTPVLEYLLVWGLRLSLPRTWADLVLAIPFNRNVFGETTSLAAVSSRFSEKLAGYKKPVLFVNGEYDLAFRMDERRFLKRIPQARLRLIRHTDHTAPMRRSQEFLTVVREFADRVFGETA